MKKALIILAALLGVAQTSAAADYNYLSAQELKGWLEAARPVLLVDIQETKDFSVHHIKGSLETNAYPVKSDEDRRKLEPALREASAGGNEAVVVVCPRGKGGAKRAYEYLADNGVLPTKLFILTGGMSEWPYQEWTEAK